MATYDREWEPTLRFAERTYGSGVLIGEFPLFTEGGKTRRRVDGILIRGGTRFEAHQWKDLLEESSTGYWADRLHGGRLVVIQTKLTTVGLAVLGQALLSDLLIAERFNPRALETVALASGADQAISRLLANDLFRRLRVEVDPRYPPRRPRLEPKREPLLRRAYAQRALPDWACVEGFDVTPVHSIEAVYVRGQPVPRSPTDLTGRHVVLVHSAEKPHLDLIGHVVFGAALVKQIARPASLSSRLVVRRDDRDLTSLLPQFPDTQLVLPGDW
ncbi:MAG: hypothetical protein R3C15_19740 [Thermoleophilia bacterium]